VITPASRYIGTAALHTSPSLVSPHTLGRAGGRTGALPLFSSSFPFGGPQLFFLRLNEPFSTLAAIYNHLPPTMSRPTVLLLGEPPIYQTALWETFQTNFEVIQDTSSSREEFIQALKDNK
jgi:hypothetical protein